MNKSHILVTSMTIGINSFFSLEKSFSFLNMYLGGCFCMNKKTDKAYNNKDFLNGKAARPVRVLCELIEPEERLRRIT